MSYELWIMNYELWTSNYELSSAVELKFFNILLAEPYIPLVFSPVNVPVYAGVIQCPYRHFQYFACFFNAVELLRFLRGGQHAYQLLKQFYILLLFIHLSQQYIRQIRCLFVSFYVNPFWQFYYRFILLSFLLLVCHSKWRSLFMFVWEQKYSYFFCCYFQILILFSGGAVPGDVLNFPPNLNKKRILKSDFFLRKSMLSKLILKGQNCLNLC